MAKVKRIVEVPIYWLIIGFVTSIVSPVLAVVASNRIAEGNRAEVAATQRESGCELFGKLLDVYEETPPSTPAGQNVRQAYLDYYNNPQLLDCEPKRK